MKKLIVLSLLFLLRAVPIESQPFTDNTCSEPIKVNLTTEERIIQILADSGYSIRMQQIILAQAKHESGSFKNPLTRKHNNIFAMLHNKKDPYSLGGLGYAENRMGYASYPTIEHNVYAYIWYTKAKGYPKDTDLKSYVRFMKSKGYFECGVDLYINALSSHIKKDLNLFSLERQYAKKVNY